MNKPDESNAPSLEAGRVRSFLFEQLDIRGAWVQLDRTWRDMIAGRGYAAATTALLGEMAAVTALMAGNLKQPGRLTFQLRGEGAVNRLVMDCNEQMQLRGMAHEAPKNETMAHESLALESGMLDELLGEGFLTLTLDAPDMRQPYQSQVPLIGDSLAAVFEHYLAQSEQQPARLWLAANEKTAAGLFLQALPRAHERDEDGWNRVQILANTLSHDELLKFNSMDLLARLFPEEDVRVYDPRPVAWHCPEDWVKIAAMLRSIGRAECESIVQEVGEIHVHDEICNRDYRLNATDVGKLFSQ
ncbi:MAG: Hsp33 family molecular chaperone HslO [Thiobacillaceae bacterium]